LRSNDDLGHVLQGFTPIQWGAVEGHPLFTNSLLTHISFTPLLQTTNKCNDARSGPR
jgi:hypothetical protein